MNGISEFIVFQIRRWRCIKRLSSTLIGSDRKKLLSLLFFSNLVEELFVIVNLIKEILHMKEKKMKKEKEWRMEVSCDLIPLENMSIKKYLYAHHIPLTAPVWLPALEANHMRPDDPVLGFLVEEKPYALPWWIIKNHHVANLTLEGRPIVVKLCEVCSSSAAYNPIVDGKRLTFHVGGSYKGTFITMDYETRTVWSPFTGEALLGPLKGKRLERLPIYQSNWAEWTSLYPASRVPNGEGESREGHGADRRPGSAEPEGTSVMGSLVHRDPRLPYNELVLGVECNGQARAYSLEKLHQAWPVVNDVLGGHEIVVFSRPQSWMAIAFSRHLDGQCLDFEVDVDGHIVDRATGSRWDISGKANCGSLAGRALPFMPSGIEEWYAWASYHPDTEIFDSNSLQ